MIMAVSLLLAACTKDPYDGVESNERSIEAVTLGGGLVQVGPAAVDRMAGKVSVTVLMTGAVDLSSVVTQIQASYGATISPSPTDPVNFAANNNKTTYTITSEKGETREWTVEIVPFTETILGTWDIQQLVVYGGTGPEYGGGAVLKMTDKPWVWPATNGPAAEEDNTLTFEFTGVTATGRTYGNIINNAGPDGLYADFQFQNPATNVNNFYRTIPQGIGIWERDYGTGLVYFRFPDGKVASGTLASAGVVSLGNGNSKTITDNSFDFTLNGTDDWANIYSDYDKFVKKPRRYFIDIKKQ